MCATSAVTEAETTHKMAELVLELTTIDGEISGNLGGVQDGEAGFGKGRNLRGL